MKQIAFIVIAIAALLATHVFAQTPVVTGSDQGKASMAAAVDLTAKIVAIDTATRDITLQGSKGIWVVVTAGPQVKNFDQLKVGDVVHINYTEALVLELKKFNDLAVVRTEQGGVMAAAPGAQPGGVVTRRITAVADVIAVNRDTQTVTLQGPQLTRDVKVADPQMFNRISKGDQMYVTYTQAMAVAVEPSPNK